VLCRHLDPSRLASRVVQEHVVAGVAGVGETVGVLRDWNVLVPGMA
jgi:hypothetical protein